MQDISDRITSEVQQDSVLSVPEVQYFIGGSILLAATAIISYYFHRKKPAKQYNNLHNSLLDQSTAQEN